MSWLQLKRAYSLRFLHSHGLSVVIRASALTLTTNAALYDKVYPRRRPAPYQPTLSDKCLHMLLRTRDWLRSLRRYSFAWTLATMTVLFFGSYFFFARRKYPNEPINLYEWNALKDQDGLSPDMVKKAEMLEAFIERRWRTGID